MFLDSGVQAQVNITSAQEELLQDLVRGPSGTFAAYVSITNFAASATGVILRALDATGQASGIELSLALPPSGFGAVGEATITGVFNLANGGFAVIYEDNVFGSPGSPFQQQSAIRMQIYDSTGTASGAVTTLATNPANGFVFATDVAVAPNGGFSVGTASFGGAVPDYQIMLFSDLGAFGASIPVTGNLVEFSYLPSSGLVTLGFNQPGIPNFSVDFPGISPPNFITTTSTPSRQHILYF